MADKRNDLHSGAMARKRPAFFEQARGRLEPQLEKLGFSLAEEHYHPAIFGSAFAVYQRTGARFRLVWDGKEGALTGGVASGRGNKWEDIEQRSVAGRPLPLDREHTEERIERLAKAVEAVLGPDDDQATDPPLSDALLCCFCGQSITRTTIDPCFMKVSTFSGRDQMFFCHAECLKGRLAKVGNIFTPAFF